jgi:hypothetical protein
VTRWLALHGHGCGLRHGEKHRSEKHRSEKQRLLRIDLTPLSERTHSRKHRIFVGLCLRGASTEVRSGGIHFNHHGLQEWLQIGCGNPCMRCGLVPRRS